MLFLYDFYHKVYVWDIFLLSSHMAPKFFNGAIVKVMNQCLNYGKSYLWVHFG